MSDGIQLEQVTYIREVKDPTLKQYMIRRNMKEVSAKTKGENGVMHDGVKPIPRSASIIKKKIGGTTADKLMEQHPDWVSDYNEKYKSS